jgi:hypothetical protein
MATSGPTRAVARSGEPCQRTASIRLTEAMIANGTAVERRECPRNGRNGSSDQRAMIPAVKTTLAV